MSDTDAIATAPLTTTSPDTSRLAHLGLVVGLLVLVAAPFIGLYPVFVMTALCYAIFACAFNLLLGYTGLLSFGHAAAPKAGRPSSGSSPESRSRRCSASSSASSPSAARASTSR